MPPEKNNNNQSRPLMPTLAASNRNTKPPLTPKLAPSNTPSNNSAARRAAASSEPPAATKDDAKADQATPVKPFVVVDVTPRLSSRKSRADSAQSTPNGAPNSGRPKSKPTSPVRNGGLAGFNLNGFPSRPKSMINRSSSTVFLARSPGILSLGRSGSEVGGRSDSPKFFHASDVKLQESGAKAAQQKKQSPFFYANGDREQPDEHSPRATSPVLSAVSEKRSTGQLFHKDRAVADIITNTPLLSPSLTASPRSPIAPDTAPLLPAPSPPKDNIHLSYRKGVSQVIGVRNKVQRFNPTSPASILPDRSPLANYSEPQRRSSIEMPKKSANHRKSPSLSSVGSSSSALSARKRSLTLADHPSSSASPGPLSTVNDNIPSYMAASPRLRPLSIDTKSDLGGTSDLPKSPIVSAHGRSKPEPFNELAANARRERKVLDLEISNSSLLAINRSLEKEIRKQKAELRRFRRLSRSGRFSTATARSISGGALSTLSEDGESLDHAFSDATGDSEMETSYLSDDDEPSDADSTMSPTTLATSDARHRTNDERRLQQDLSKHRAMLVDSQRVNQSLKRCLGWTEELVKDGTKALEYQVRVNDVQLGGRVLAPDEEHEGHVPQVTAGALFHDYGRESGLLETWHDIQESKRPSFESESGDRDSGIEVESEPPFRPAVSLSRSSFGGLEGTF
ncbi:hypothetical protein B0A49_07109 [Cryomyces minteri]|uniref:Uncharacterized protein n=1 Tax=Cryomyces minteri TaxID=331657 RepID=A0A4U0X599_9PEZI|nr:hypothetical protein B0A49_07791 [Cryomyces minteri]TKA71074.1 hypothetical protein B0A49_07109 [Cryomyces minteri]